MTAVEQRNAALPKKKKHWEPGSSVFIYIHTLVENEAEIKLFEKKLILLIVINTNTQVGLPIIHIYCI